MVFSSVVLLRPSLPLLFPRWQHGAILLLGFVLIRGEKQKSLVIAAFPVFENSRQGLKVLRSSFSAQKNKAMFEFDVVLSLLQLFRANVHRKICWNVVIKALSPI